jgi:hypothetical protein
MASGRFDIKKYCLTVYMNSMMNTDMEKNKWEEYRMQHEKAEAQAKAKLLEAKRKLKLLTDRAPLTELKILERYKI